MWGDLSPDGRAAEDAALLALLVRLKEAGYVFTAVNASTHRLVARRRARARPGSLRDIFGWGLGFDSADIPGDLLDEMLRGRVLDQDEGLFRSTARVSTVDGEPFLHSADRAAEEAVFLGPDTYRFVRFLKAALADGRAFRSAVDVGTGAGVGALVLAGLRTDAEIWATDINPQALRLARVNAQAAGRSVRLVETSGLEGLDGPFDLIVANPPFIAQGGRTYRDGGDRLGTGVTLAWLEQALGRLAPEGRAVFYTGAPIVEGRDGLKEAVGELAEARGLSLGYDEIDPDIFGSTLAGPAYREVERIAAVGMVLGP